jgi:pimeloyl-ACP methyl ester carboxylesterase
VSVTRGARVAIVALIAVVALGGVALPYVDALAFVVRAAKLPGAAATFAGWRSENVASTELVEITTRHGAVIGRLYRPSGVARRTVTLVPGVHMDGIDESRLVGMAEDLTKSGYAVLTVAPPDLRRFRITPDNTDIIEDAAVWLVSRGDVAGDGRIGMVGISFSGGLSIVAAGRPALTDKVAFVLSFGGHGELPRVLRYLCSAQAQAQPSAEALAFVTGAEHLTTKPPHDYGVAVVLLGLADQVVPVEQVEPLREGIRIFLAASSLTLVDMKKAEQEFVHAREYEATLLEPARSLMSYVNNRAVDKLGPILLPVVDRSGGILHPALSPERSPIPKAPVFLLHGSDDTVIPSAETIVLADRLRGRTEVHALLSGLITHAEVDRGAAASEVWRLVDFWRDLMEE